jgi:hypothetical protein
VALLFKNRIKMSTDTVGTGTLNLTGAVTKYRSIVDAGGYVDGDTVRYVLESGNDWEVGLGTIGGTGTSLSRDTVHASSNAGAKIPMAGGQVAIGAFTAEDVIDIYADILSLSADIAAISKIQQNSKSAAYTLVASDAAKHIYHPSADTTARIWTIPSNASVPFEIGTTITFDNDFGAGAVTIAITSDTLVLVGLAGSTGSRTLASGGQATALKVGSTRWRISGVGLT